MRQEVHGCFAQMDRSLALPKIRARVLLQQFQTAWREAEFQKLDQALAAPEMQVRVMPGGSLVADVGRLSAPDAPPGSSHVALLCSRVGIRLLGAPPSSS